MTLADWSISTATPPLPSGAATEIGLVPTTGFCPPDGAMDAGALVNPMSHQPGLCQGAGMLTQHAAIVGIADRQRRDALGAGHPDQGVEPQRDGGMREAGLGIDRDHAGTCFGQDRHRLTIDLAAGHMLAIDRDIGQTVAGHAVGLGRGGGFRQGPRVCVRRARRDERLKCEVFDLGPETRFRWSSLLSFNHCR